MAADLSRASSRKQSQQRQVFTFFVQDMMFGLAVENVLMLGQDVDKIQNVPVEEQGFCGVTKFQGVVVPVIDFAHRLGVASGLDIKKQLLDKLNQLEREHLEWVRNLTQSLLHSETFSLDLEAGDCSSSLWLRQFTCRDESLNELIHACCEPHQQLHDSGVAALAQTYSEDPQALAKQFQQQANIHLQRLRALGQRAKEQLESDMRQVLLFVTDDGKTPRYALLLDEIHDVISYDIDEFQSSSAGALAQIRKIRAILSGIFSRDDHPDCLFFDIDKLADSDLVADHQI